MTRPLFETAPNYCPDCGHKLGASNAIDGFEQGNICNCSACQFEYAKLPNPDALLDCPSRHNRRFQRFWRGEMRCLACDLEASESKVQALTTAIADGEKELKRINAIHAQQLDYWAAEAWRESAETVADRVIEMIRGEARAAVIEAFNMPVGDIIRGYGSAEQMGNVETGTVQITYRGKADPFIAID